MAANKRPRPHRTRTLRGLTTASRPGAAADRMDNLKADALKVGLLAATGSLIVGAIFLTKGAITKAVEESRESKASQAVSTLYTPAYWADRLRSAFNPSGIESLRSMDTTDVTGVHNVARGLRTQAQMVLVNTAYYNLTRRRLSDDMRQELSPGEVQEFWKIMARKPLK